jgi:hypothetical protein
MQCSNSPPGASIVGLNTLLLSASNVQTPDIIALAATQKSDGYVGVADGTGAFAVATVNVGSGGNIVASVDTGSSTLPVTVTMCQTNPVTGQCISAIQSTVATTINANATPTFAIFVTATIPPTSAYSCVSKTPWAARRAVPPASRCPVRNSPSAVADVAVEPTPCNFPWSRPEAI